MRKILAETRHPSAAPNAASRPPVATRVRFLPAHGSAGRELIGGVFEGSNVSATEGFALLAKINSAPPNDQWSELPCVNETVYRWLRYVAPAGSHARLASVEFYDGDQLIAGDGKGVRRSTFAKEPLAAPLEGRARYWYEADSVNPQLTSYDLVDAATAPRPSFKPARAEQPGPVDVTLNSAPGAVIRYTLDGSWPSPNHGEVYERPIPISKTTTISAVAIAEGRAPSHPSTVTYLIGAPARPVLSSAHIGNSLTATTGGFPRYARSAGYEEKYVSFLRGGALTKELWALASGAYASDPAAAAKEAAALKKGSTPWSDFWKKVGPIDILTVQPRDFKITEEAAADIHFFNLFRQKSPDLQPWLYCEWTEMNRPRVTDKGELASRQLSKLYPALTWEESMGAMLLYMEDLQQTICETYHDGKRPRILPAALAMGWLKDMIDSGQLPGLSPGSFYPLLFADGVHPAFTPAVGSANGAFVVDSIWHAAFYRESPEGKVLPLETTFTPEQARLVQRLAWGVSKNYPDCGMYEEGSTPCGLPQLTRAGLGLGEVTPCTLSSSTPGAWFRYTLDGTVTTRTRGLVYCGVISVRPGMIVKAVAYRSGMADSAPAELIP
jgi:hypothetical protein